MTTLKQLAINLEKTAEKYASQDIEAKKLLDSIHSHRHFEVSFVVGGMIQNKGLYILW